MIGGPPFTDEGTYQYNTWLAGEVGGSLPIAPINGYAWLASWLGADSDAPFLRARVFDAFVGAIAAGAFAMLLRRFCAAWTAGVLATLWALLAAAPVINDAGYKNPIIAAWIPMFCALGLAMRRDRRGSLRAGILVACACWLREAFAPAALLVPCVVFVRRGVRQAGRCLVGGLLGGLAVVLWMFAVGCDPAAAIKNLLAASTNASELLRVTGGDPVAIRWNYFQWMLDFFSFLMWPAIVGLLTVPLWRKRKWGLAAPVLALALLPLPEIFGKFCLPYHWFQLAPAALVLGAIAWRRCGAWSRQKGGMWRTVPVVTWVVLLGWIYMGSKSVIDNVRGGMALHDEFRGVMIDGDWSDPSIERSRYLSEAAWLRRETKADAKVLVSGYAYGVYVLAHRRPASIEVSDLTYARMTGQHGRHPEWFEAMRSDPPDVILETMRWPEPLDEIWPDFADRYTEARVWGAEPAVHYGTFGMRAWSHVR